LSILTLLEIGGIMSGDINKINVKGLITKDGYCLLANIPEMFCEIAEDAGKQLINVSVKFPASYKKKII
jgi:hypothetical protein